MTFEFDIEKVSKKVAKLKKQEIDLAPELEEAKMEFFAAATERLENEPRATRTIMIPASEKIASDEEVESYVHKFYPEWRILKIEDEPFRVLVEEDPAWMKYSYISKDRKTIFNRGIAQASPDLDDSTLREEDPALWKRVTTSREEQVLMAFAQEYESIDPEVIVMAQAWLTEHQDEFTRILKPFEDLDEEDFEAVQKYIVPGKLSYRFERPRKPKPEELE